jgi:hypothetical protein
MRYLVQKMWVRHLSKLFFIFLFYIVNFELDLNEYTEEILFFFTSKLIDAYV